MKKDKDCDIRKSTFKYIIYFEYNLTETYTAVNILGRTTGFIYVERTGTVVKPRNGPRDQRS